MAAAEKLQLSESFAASSCPKGRLQKATILVVAGETSGEEHAAGLVQEINKQCSQIQIQWFGSGSHRMAEVGVELLEDVSQLAAIGPWDAVQNLPSYWNLYRRILKEVRLRRPRLAILIDFPEFNLKLARRLKQEGVPVCYFIAPQIWAWRSSRLRQIRKFVDLILVVLPFEQDFYRRNGVEAHFVGNPFLARLRGVPPSIGSGPDQEQVVALLPGSRIQEVHRIFPILLDAAEYVAQQCKVRFWVVKAPDIPIQNLRQVYRQWARSRRKDLSLEFREEGSAQLLSQADCAIIKSGTSTLEATLLQVPFAMVYRMSWPTWIFARLLVRTQNYCLANLVMGERIVPEFIQWNATGDAIGSYLVRLLTQKGELENVKKKLREAAVRLGHSDAYCEAARHVREFLRE